MVSPRVFVPYSPVNINQAYADCKNLNNIWDEAFFAGIRKWQDDFEQEKGSCLMPCIIRDHHHELRRLIAQYEPEPNDENGALIGSI